jgi:hypothetical protein
MFDIRAGLRGFYGNLMRLSDTNNKKQQKYFYKIVER